MNKSKQKTGDPPPVKKGRTYTIPIEHLSLVADRILTTNPTHEIILNTLKSIWVDGKNYGYFSRLRESKNFKDRRELTIKETFDAIKDRIDDLIHSYSDNQNNN